MAKNYQEIYNILRERIQSGEWQVGTPLPSENDLSRQLQVSRNTLRRALKLLIDEKIILRQPGVGSFVESVPAERRSTLIGLIFHRCLERTFYSHALLEGIQSLVNKYDFQLQLFQQQDLPHINIAAMDGVIAVNPERLLMKELNTMLRPDQHVVVINRDVVLPGFSFLTVDYVEESYRIVNYALSLGYRKIAILGYDEGYFGFALRTVGWRKAFQDNKLDFPRDLMLSFDDAEQMSVLKKFLREKRPEAIFVAGGGLMNHLMVAGMQQDPHFFEKTLVMCYDDFSDQEAWNEIPIVYVQMPLRQMAQTAVRILVEYPQNNQEVQKVFHSRFVFNAGCLQAKIKKQGGNESAE